SITIGEQRTRNTTPAEQWDGTIGEQQDPPAKTAVRRRLRSRPELVSCMARRRRTRFHRRDRLRRIKVGRRPRSRPQGNLRGRGKFKGSGVFDSEALNKDSRPL